VITCGQDYNRAEFQLLVRKSAADGSAVWTRTYARAVSGMIAEEAWGCVVDNIIVVAYEQVGGQYDSWIRKYTP
jgi:hypothetical protein